MSNKTFAQKNFYKIIDSVICEHNISKIYVENYNSLFDTIKKNRFEYRNIKEYSRKKSTNFLLIKKLCFRYTEIYILTWYKENDIIYFDVAELTYNDIKDKSKLIFQNSEISFTIP